MVSDEKCYVVFLKVEIVYGIDLDENDSVDNKIYIVMVWLLGESIDLES